MMKIRKLLFIGQTWNGSSARSLRDALSSIEDVEIDDIGEDHYRPKGRNPIIRTMNRLLLPLYRREISREILNRCRILSPDALVVFKGNLVTKDTIAAVQAMGIKAVNVFPDASPHAHGEIIKSAMGQYDLVISTKPFHPEHWHTTYGYKNKCVCVPHGYDPDVHYWPDPPMLQDLDIAIAASWRPQYENLMIELGHLLPDTDISVALAGPGWKDHRDQYPRHWQFPGARHGRAYGEFIRRAKIIIAPVHTEMVIGKLKQPGDQDTRRTYELAAAGTFFLHRRTPFASKIYTEGKECDFWSDANELAVKIRHYLPLEHERRAMALAAHQRAVPSFSSTARAQEVMEHISAVIKVGSGC